jgi:hypothetical protein
MTQFLHTASLRGHNSPWKNASDKYRLIKARVCSEANIRLLICNLKFVGDPTPIVPDAEGPKVVTLELLSAVIDHDAERLTMKMPPT